MIDQGQEDPTPLADLGEVYRRHAQPLRAFALYLSGDPALADDLVAECFCRAWTVRERVQTATVRGYLFAIVRNLFLRELRRGRRRSPLDDRTADGRPGPEAETIGRSDLRAVLKALQTLPEVDRAAVLMRAGDALPYEEIAAALGLGLSTAKVKVHRARLRLAAALRPLTGTDKETDHERHP